MRGIHSVVDDLRRQVFTEVARLAYEGGDYSRIDPLPYEIVPGEVAKFRHNIFLERAIVTERLRLACGLPLRPASVHSPASDGIEEAALPEKYYEPPLINIITFACNACPPKEIRISTNCQGCLSHPCQASAPRTPLSSARTARAPSTSPSASSAASARASAPTTPSASWSGPVPWPAAWTPSAPTSSATPRSTMTSASPAACAWSTAPLPPLPTRARSSS